MTQREKAEDLRRAHAEPGLLVLVNVWDAASARVVAGVPGCRALATASWSIAAAHGVPDGEWIGRDAMLAAIGRIAAAAELPVSADLEAGFGTTAADVGETVAGAIAQGAVGCNLEDGAAGGERTLRPAAEHAERVAAARAAGEEAGIPIVINARTDVFLAGAGEPEERVALALERGRAYVAAGADCVFVPGAREPDDLRRLVAGMGAPVSVIGSPSGPSPAELERLGVARMSLGPGSLAVAMAALRRAAEQIVGGGPLPADVAWRP
jgi:2-methylisocitrate lyase-like PEP mutase family enzyme